jgi:hypothetical protein
VYGLRPDILDVASDESEDSNTDLRFTLCYPIPMQQPVKERVRKLREEIAEITEDSRLYAGGGKRMPGSSSDQERRIQRLEEILKELKSLTDWKKQ